VLNRDINKHAERTHSAHSRGALRSQGIDSPVARMVTEREKGQEQRRFNRLLRGIAGRADRAQGQVSSCYRGTVMVIESNGYGDRE
jgi:hypothetical protein